MSVLALVVLMHAALFLAFKRHSGSGMSDSMVELIETELVEVAPPEMAAVPLPAPMSESSLAFVPPSMLAVRTPVLTFEDADQPPEPISTTAMVEFCVQEDGHLDASSVNVTKSTGVPKLDEAAINIAKHWRLPPSTANGKSKRVCGVTAPIQFKLPERPAG